MSDSLIWLLKLIVAHLLTDFVVQPKSWVEERRRKHFASPKLYLHAAITGLVAWLLLGWNYWWMAPLLFVPHILTDAWKSYRPATLKYFLIDQGLHLAVILAYWYVFFLQWTDLQTAWRQFSQDPATWKLLAGIIFLTRPSALIIELFTRKWREQIGGPDTLENAGKWIGIAERLIILIFVLYSQFAAIGLLVAAKAIIRFSEKDRQEIKTEYLVLGTLLSISLAVVTGLLVRNA